MPRRAFLAEMSIVAAAACAPSPVPAARSDPVLSPVQPSAALPPGTGPAAELVRAASGRPEVALTFHGAGDPVLAAQVLGLLAHGGAAATVLAVGQWVQQYRDGYRPLSTRRPVLRAAGAAGYPRVLSYDVDSRDFTDPGAAAIRRNVAAAAAGSVVSMHLGHPETLAALPGVLDDLAARGLTPVIASRLFG